MKLSVVSIENNLIRIAVQGEIQAPDVGDPLLGLEPLLGDGWATKRVLMDFGGMRMAGSAAIGWLLAVNRKFRESGGMLALHSMRPDVARAFKLLRVDSVLHIFPDEQTALLSLEGSNG
jgi:anti-sigma B factor antagonist